MKSDRFGHVQKFSKSLLILIGSVFLVVYAVTLSLSEFLKNQADNHLEVVFNDFGALDKTVFTITENFIKESNLLSIIPSDNGYYLLGNLYELSSNKASDLNLNFSVYQNAISSYRESVKINPYSFSNRLKLVEVLLMDNKDKVGIAEHFYKAHQLVGKNANSNWLWLRMLVLNWSRLGTEMRQTALASLNLMVKVQSPYLLELDVLLKKSPIYIPKCIEGELVVKVSHFVDCLEM